MLTRSHGHGLTILGKQGYCEYAIDKYGQVWYRIAPERLWTPVGY